MAGEWRDQLPADLKTNETFTPYETLGDFGKAHVETVGKLKELDGRVKGYEGEITTLKANSIPKLSENATPEQRDAFYKALGRPDKPEEYEVPDVDGQKNSPEMVSWMQKESYRLGLPKSAVKELSVSFNKFMGGIVKAEMDKRAEEKAKVETTLKSELGDKYDASIEMVRRVWQKLSNSDFDAFVNETKIGNDPRLIRFMIEVAKKTGDDTSINGDPGKTNKGEPDWFPNTPSMRKK